MKPSINSSVVKIHQCVPPSRSKRLVVGRRGLGELKVDALAGEALVDLGVGVEAVVDAAALLLVEDDLEDLAAVLAGADALADNLDGVDEVVQDGVVDGGQGARAGALLRLVAARAVAALGAGQDAARGDDQDVAVRELLLELTGDAVVPLARCENWERRPRLTAAGPCASQREGERGRR